MVGAAIMLTGGYRPEEQAGRVATPRRITESGLEHLEIELSGTFKNVFEATR
jgi:pyrroline-5-carboxylate reductase